MGFVVVNLSQIRPVCFHSESEEVRPALFVSGDQNRCPRRDSLIEQKEAEEQMYDEMFCVDSVVNVKGPNNMCL